MKRINEVLGVDAINFYKKDGEVIVRLITPSRSYDMYLLPHHAEGIADSLRATAKGR
jgi:hypothetical protein